MSAGKEGVGDPMLYGARCAGADADTMAWKRVCAREEILEGSVKAFIVNDRPIMLTRINNAVRALDAICTHKPAYLPLGKAEGSCLECPMHNAVYDMETGKSLKGPHHLQGAVIPVPDLRMYPVNEAPEGIMVDV